MYKKSENAHRATLSQESTIALECVARANDLSHAWITYEAFECFSTQKTGSGILWRACVLSRIFQYGGQTQTFVHLIFVSGVANSLELLSAVRKPVILFTKWQPISYIIKVSCIFLSYFIPVGT